MADFNALEALINAYIKKNGVQAITGQILNGVLRGMVDALGKGFTVAGEASPNTDPGTMTGPVMYIAHTAGTYTHFDNIAVNQGEVAMLIYNEQAWTKNVVASLAAAASVDENVGTPEVGVSFVDGLLTFDFRNMKGNTGDAAGFGTIAATVDANIGTPAVTVNTSGPDTAKNITFAFRNLKGETGVTSVIATVDNTIGTPSCAVSLVGQELHLDFSGLKGAQGDTGSSVAYPFTIVNNLTTDDATQALSAAMGVQLEGEITQLELEVTDLDENLDIVVSDVEIQSGATLPQYINYTNGVAYSSQGNCATDYVDVSAYRGKSIKYLQNIYPDASGTVGMAFYDANKSFVSGVPCHFGGTRGYEENTIVVPNNASYARFTIFADYANLFFVDVLSVASATRLTRIESSVESINGKLKRKEDIDTTFVIGEGIQAYDGAAIAVSGGVRTDHIPVAPGDVVSYTGVVSSPAYSCNIYGYDANKVKVAPILDDRQTTFTDEYVTIPDGVYFIRCDFKRSVTHSIKRVVDIGLEEVANNSDEAIYTNIPIRFNLDLAIYKPDGTKRSNLYGFISEKYILNGESKFYLKNFYEQYDPTNLCVAIFFGADDSVVGYTKFKNTSVNDYVVEVPVGASYCYFCTERDIDGHPETIYQVVAVSRKENEREKKEEQDKATLRGRFDTLFNRSLSEVMGKKMGANITYRKDVATQYDHTLSVGVGQEYETISDAISFAENTLTGTIRISVVGDYPAYAEHLEWVKNRYIINGGNFTGMKRASIIEETSGITKIGRETSGDIPFIIVDGDVVPICSNGTEEMPDELPKFTNSPIGTNFKLEEHDENGYYYEFFPESMSGLEVGAIVKIFCEWICYVGKVTEVRTNSVVLFSKSGSGQPLQQFTGEVRYLVLNTSELLSAGTFYYDNDYIYYYGTIQTSVEVPFATKLFTINGDGMVFDGCNFFGTAILSWNYRNSRQAEVDRNSAVDVESAKDIHFLGCSFERLSENGLHIFNNSRDISVQGCLFKNIGCGAISVNQDILADANGNISDKTEDVYIASNIIRDYGQTVASGAGIVCTYGDNVSIISNKVFHGYYTGISVGWGWNNKYHLSRNNAVIGNEVHHILCFVMGDGGGIYLQGNMDGAVIDNNKIYCVNGIGASLSGIGLYRDSGASSIIDFGNLVYACDLGIFSAPSHINNRGNYSINDVVAYIGSLQTIRYSDGFLNAVMASIISSESIGRIYTQFYGNYFRIVDSVLCDIETGKLLESEETPQVYNPFDVMPIFNDPENDDFTLSNVGDFADIGFVWDGIVDQRGVNYPKFSNSFTNEDTLDAEYISNYKTMYLSLSPNKQRRNAYFNP